MRPEPLARESLCKAAHVAKRIVDVQQRRAVFPLFGQDPKPLKSRDNPTALGSPIRTARAGSEPLFAAAAARAVPVVVAFHPAMAPAALAAEPAMMGQDRKPPFLSVIKRLVERIGCIRDLLHRRR